MCKNEWYGMNACQNDHGWCVRMNDMPKWSCAMCKNESWVTCKNESWIGIDHVIPELFFESMFFIPLVHE